MNDNDELRMHIEDPDYFTSQRDVLRQEFMGVVAKQLGKDPYQFVRMMEELSSTLDRMDRNNTNLGLTWGIMLLKQLYKEQGVDAVLVLLKDD